jgi:predicted TIM-barrel fold metal-dependent hydrolase
VIVDCHTHLWAPSHLGSPFTDEVRGAGGAAPDLRADPETHTRGTGAADAVCVFAFRARRLGVCVPNDYIAEYVATDPGRLYGYACVDPTEPGAGAELDRAVHELGLRGLKLVPTYGGWHPLDERALDVYARAEELGLPVTFHFGTTPHPLAELEYARPIHADEIARRFPRLRIVIAHVAHPWEVEALVVCRKHEHVYADVSALVYRPYQLYGTLRLAVEYAVDGKLLLGSDFPWVTTAGQIDGLRRLTVADADRP